MFILVSILWFFLRERVVFICWCIGSVILCVFVLFYVDFFSISFYFVVCIYFYLRGVINL